MGRIRDWGRNALTLLALASAGAIGASASAPADSHWAADPDDQFLLDVNIRQLRLGDGVRAYPTPEGTCVILGDFLTTLDLPVRIDLEARTAAGWASRSSRGPAARRFCLNRMPNCRSSWPPSGTAARPC